ncbi:hypothetical protein B0H17DRAFT_512800 [Mycena rosella]|uniref:Diaminopimelate epimerase-like protein n=1 Tax=Mycena rosella TaxID=1033263 RepID=A0AAD7DJR8_MYCRO|nr:hypothetical protein B0H17DRAFT_512800 [Mycena rosella]
MPSMSARRILDISDILPEYLDFQLLNAFSNSSFAGNPAAIVFLKEIPSDNVLEKIKDNFNQPIVVYVFPPKIDTPQQNGVAVFGMRWYGPWGEVHICGHGTLAATEAIFRRLDPTEQIHTLEFQTLSGTLTAQRAGDKISMELPAGRTLPASTEEAHAVHAVFCRALGKPSVAINYIGYGGPGFKNYLMVEVAEAEDLATWRPKVEHFAELAPRTQILVVTSASRHSGISYETRMFAPTIGVPEDHACGSAHCLNAPYWAGKRGYSNGHEQQSKGVSVRGGDIWAAYFEGVGEDPGRVQLRGNVKLTASGTLDLTDVVLN